MGIITLGSLAHARCTWLEKVTQRRDDAKTRNPCRRLLFASQRLCVPENKGDIVLVANMVECPLRSSEFDPRKPKMIKIHQLLRDLLRIAT